MIRIFGKLINNVLIIEIIAYNDDAAHAWQSVNQGLPSGPHHHDDDMRSQLMQYEEIHLSTPFSDIYEAFTTFYCQKMACLSGQTPLHLGTAE